jgi:hypothetical protein
MSSTSAMGKGFRSAWARTRKLCRRPLIDVLEPRLMLSAAKGTSLLFSSFNSTAGLNVVGSAASSSNDLLLTPADYFDTGGAWATAKQNIQEGFETTFRFGINELGGFTDDQGNPGGDGFAFVIQNASPTALGNYGEEMGYGGIANSVAVEFDTYQNSYDPNGNHVSVHTAGAGVNDSGESFSLGSTTNIPNLSDGYVHTGKIAYLPGSMSVYIDNLTKPSLTVKVDLGKTLKLDYGRAWAGFTAATGSAYENHWILNWSFAGQPLAPASISGTVFSDADSNGVRGSGENGIANRTVWLDNNNNGIIDAGEQESVTDALGGYKFSGLSPGVKYWIRQVTPFGWSQTLPSGGPLYGWYWTPQPGQNGIFNFGEHTASLRSSLLHGALTRSTDHKTTAVYIERSSGGLIDPNATTWLLIHGRNESPTDMSLVMSALHAARPGDQVLTLNWSDAASVTNTVTDFTEQDWIPWVAKWAANELSGYGFSGSKLNVVGHSWGADVADELGKQFIVDKQGKLNSLVALDPARGLPATTTFFSFAGKSYGLHGGSNYNQDTPGEINFSAVARYSWAFRSSTFGSVTSPATATDAFSVIIKPTPPPWDAHNLAIDVFAKLIQSGGLIGPFFPLERLLGTDAVGTPWVANQFGQTSASVGSLSGNTGYVFEATLTVDGSGKPLELDYIWSFTGKKTIVKA